jgi:hypothetical protein
MNKGNEIRVKFISGPKLYDMKAYKGRGDEAWLSLYYNTRWRRMVHFTLRSFYPVGNSLRYALGWRDCASQSPFGRDGENKIFCPFRKSKSGHRACNPTHDIKVHVVK